MQHLLNLIHCLGDVMGEHAEELMALAALLEYGHEEGDDE